MTSRIDQFLGARGYRAEVAGPGGLVAGAPLPVSRPAPAQGPAEAGPTPLDFVCEEDVRKALQAGRQLVVAERAIITPAARELGEAHRVFAAPPWRG